MKAPRHDNPELHARQKAWFRERAKSARGPVFAVSLLASGFAIFRWFLSSERPLSTLAVMLLMTLVVLPAIALPAVIFSDTSKRPH